MLGQQITRRELGLEKEKLDRAPALGPASISGPSGAGVALPVALPSLSISDGGSGIRDNSVVLGDASDVSGPTLSGAGLLESILTMCSQVGTYA